MTSFAPAAVSNVQPNGEEVGAKHVPGGNWWVVLEDTSEQRVQAVCVTLQVEDEDSVLIATPGKTCSDTLSRKVDEFNARNVANKARAYAKAGQGDKEPLPQWVRR